MNWFKKHLNWTWVISYTLTLCLAYSLLIYFISMPPLPAPKTLVATSGHWTDSQIVDNKGTNIVVLGEYIEGKSEWITDEKALTKQIASQQFLKNMIVLFWFCPIYLLGIFVSGKWVLKQKQQKLWWLWVTLVFPIIIIILPNKNAN